jgi:hypothetical protein
MPVGLQEFKAPRFQDSRYMNVFVRPAHRPPLPPENIPGTHFCWRLSRPQGHSAAGRILRYSVMTYFTFVEFSRRDRNAVLQQSSAWLAVLRADSLNTEPDKSQGILIAVLGHSSE